MRIPITDRIRKGFSILNKYKGLQICVDSDCIDVIIGNEIIDYRDKMELNKLGWEYLCAENMFMFSVQRKKK